MEKKLHLVEGVPAVGKSTYSYRLKSELESIGMNVKYFKEETCQPVDLFRQAVLTKEQYLKIINMNPSGKFIKEIEENSCNLGVYIIVAYTQLNYSSQLEKEVFSLMRKFDIGDGHVDYNEYKRFHFLLWDEFAKKTKEEDCCYIAEGAFLHNQLLDIIGFYDLSYDSIKSYYSTLISIILPLKPRVYYLYPSNVEILVNNALKERGCWSGSWGHGFFKWLQYSQFGKRLNLSGKEGLTTVYRKLNDLSLQILDDSGLDIDFIERKM